MRVIEGIASRAPQWAFLGNFDGKRWPVACQCSRPGLQNFLFFQPSLRSGAMQPVLFGCACKGARAPFAEIAEEILWIRPEFKPETQNLFRKKAIPPRRCILHQLCRCSPFCPPRGWA